jgi:hypothetical protein
MTCVRLAAALVLILGPMPFWIGCDAPPARAAQAQPAAAAWHRLGHWSGNGSRQTESFDVTTGALRLRWETRPRSGAGDARFRVWLHSAISGRPLQVFVDRAGAGAGSGTAHVADDPRVSYLVVESEHVDWTATLEEAGISTAPR